MDDPETQQVMAQPKPCVICLTPVTDNTKLSCCGQPCHTPCAKDYLKKRCYASSCPSCHRNAHRGSLSTDPPSNPCVFCAIQVYYSAKLRCCDKPCHPSCAMECNTPNPNPSHNPHCPNCQHAVPLSVMETTPTTPRRFSRDLEFREEVSKVHWPGGQWWFGTLYENENTTTSGYWGLLPDPVDPDHKTLHYLGKNQSDVIPRMKSIMSLPYTINLAHSPDKRVIHPHTFKTYPYGYQ